MEGKQGLVLLHNCVSPHFPFIGGLVAYNESGERIYVFVGIIDVLQSYGGRKKLEHAYKAMVHDGVSRANRVWREDR